MTSLDSIPYFGIGLGYRAELHNQIYENAANIDFLEIVTEQFFNGNRGINHIKTLAQDFKIIPHGINLSIGGCMSFDTRFLDFLRQTIEIVGAPYYSEHLCCTSAPGLDFGHLSPIPYTYESLNNVIQRVQFVQKWLGVPLVLENTTYYMDIPDGELSQGEFFSQLVGETGCGVLLDITNVVINSLNHGYSASDFLSEMPLNSIAHTHLAGWTIGPQGLIIDSHSKPIQNETWNLLEEVSQKFEIKGVVIEHDDDYPEFSSLVSQLAHARKIVGSVSN